MGNNYYRDNSANSDNSDCHISSKSTLGSIYRAYYFGNNSWSGSVDIWKNKKIQLANSPRLGTSYLGDIKVHTVTQDLLPVCNEWELLTKTMSSSPEIRRNCSCSQKGTPYFFIPITPSQTQRKGLITQ